MCGILGFKGDSTLKNVEIIKDLITEASIRGKHATGVSYVFDNKIKTLKEPLPAKEFFDKHYEELKRDLLSVGSISLIGHTRYSTSGLDHNQPIDIGGDLSVVLNGVVTQADPKYWTELFGIQPTTTNDTEILHFGIRNGWDVLEKFKTASMAVVGLWISGKMFAFRNTRRPAWFCKTNDSLIVSSTKNLFERAKVTGEIYQLEPGTFYQFSPVDNTSINLHSTKLTEDLQNCSL